jgi:hypothetical protein
MTLNELIERLTDIRDDYEISGDTPVRGAFQPNYPLIAGIGAITTVLENNGDKAGIYIALGDAGEYGSRDLWDDDVVEREEEVDEDDEDEDD